MRTVYKFAAAYMFCLTLCAVCTRADSGTAPGQVSFTSWSWTPFTILPLLFLAAIYAGGAARMWRRKSHAGLTWRPIGYFASGWLSLVVALDSPVHVLGEQLFSAHMIQHEILMLVSAPLLLLSRPSLIFVWALPAHARKIRPLASHWAIQTPWTLVSAPIAAWCLHALALWLWHAPVLFDATLRSDTMHAAQHLSFFATALLFWWPLVGQRRSQLGDGAAMIYVFTTGVHMSILGALLTFAPSSWYSAYTFTAPFWCLSPLEDQQLGGLIMWIPASTILFMATLFLLFRWMKHSDDRWALGTAAALTRQIGSARHED